MKKIYRGIDSDFAEAFKKSELYKLYEEHKDELFIGVRNNYLNLYYNSDSIAKVTYTREEIKCEIDKYYLEGKHYSSADKGKRARVEPIEIYNHYEVIKKNSDKKKSDEKKAQSKLFLLNNQNIDSNWFCVDIEYIRQYNDREEKNIAGFNARFDIIALSKEKPHRVALIELKYGKKAFGGESGIYKHVSDFDKFQKTGLFDSHLKYEIIEIVKSKNNLNVTGFSELPQVNELLAPEFYFITLNNNTESIRGTTPKQSMASYLFNEKGRWGSKGLSTKRVEPDFGDVTKKSNKFHATFLFSNSTNENLSIKDIIDGEYDEKIYPE